MTDKMYNIASVERTLQGEGRWSGRSAVLVRFCSCNMWSGKDEDRKRDAERTDSLCPLTCDTDFIKLDFDKSGGVYTACELLGVISKLAAIGSGPFSIGPMLILTGGEPLLQLDLSLLAALESLGMFLALETNGTIGPSYKLWEHFNWVCISPKTPWTALVECDELRILFPTYNPLDYASIRARERYISVVDRGTGEALKEDLATAVSFIHENPSWMLSTQSHKVWGIP